jgi:hypothetical protein
MKFQRAISLKRKKIFNRFFQIKSQISKKKKKKSNFEQQRFFCVDMTTTTTTYFAIIVLFVLLVSSNAVLAIRIGHNACAMQNDPLTLLKGFQDWTLMFQYKAGGQGTLINIEDVTSSTDNTPTRCFSVGIGSGNVNLPTNNSWTRVTIVYENGFFSHGATRTALTPCSTMRLFLGCDRVAVPIANFNAAITHLRLFSYALSAEEIKAVEGKTLNRDRTCGLEIDAPLVGIADIGANQAFDKFNSNSSNLVAEMSEPMLAPADVALPCPQSIVNKCGALACHECVLVSQYQKQCKMCDNFVCRPASFECPLLGPCPAENSDEFCAKILDTCIDSCNSTLISTCRCDKHFIHVGCPGEGTCSVVRSKCEGQCGNRPVLSCDCLNPTKVDCGTVQTVPEMPSSPTTKAADVIAIAIGVGGGVFCICFIVIIVLIVKVFRVRQLESERMTSTNSAKSSTQQRQQTEAVSLNSLGGNMSSVRSARPSIATAPAFVCSFCPQVFSSSVELQEHLRAHTASASDNVYGDLSMAPPKTDQYDRVEVSTNGELREVLYDSTLPDLVLTRDSRHAEPTSVDPSLPGYTTKPDEFAKFQIND